MLCSLIDAQTPAGDLLCACSNHIIKAISLTEPATALVLGVGHDDGSGVDVPVGARCSHISHED
jgi:hypothetical protein